MTSLYLSQGRTHTCGELRASDSGQEATLMGWVQRRRDFGPLIILTLRDRTGFTQITVDADHCDAATYELASTLRIGACIGAKGDVVNRADRGGEANPNMETGDIELVLTGIELFSRSEPLPFMPEEEASANELLRMKYRYIDLRRNTMNHNLQLRSDIAMATRQYFHNNGFTEVETPILMKSTPEGARDYLVPSRLEAGHFYALPQSPQIYKQILMMGGMDRYFQLARCFRDEDLRADRQPEFTQIDFEMSFVSREQIFAMVEGLFQKIFTDTLQASLPSTFPRMTYAEVMARYGEDKPDLRYGLELTDITSLFTESEFRVFRGVADAGGSIKGLSFPGEGHSNAWVKKLETLVKSRGAGGLARMRLTTEGTWDSPIAKALTVQEQEAITTAFQAKEGDLVLLIAHNDVQVVNAAMSTLRRHLAQELQLIPQTPSWHFLWVTDFPYVEYDQGAGRYFAVSHPFTQPHPEDLHYLPEEPAKMRSLSYDLVLNGFELGSGSIRIHDSALQLQMLELLGFSKEEAQAQFGFLLEALTYGPPPHGGAAFGLDRITMLMANEDSLRDVIAFPKTQQASCPMSESPGTVSAQQLQDIHLAVVAPPAKES